MVNFIHTAAIAKRNYTARDGLVEAKVRKELLFLITRPIKRIIVRSADLSLNILAN